MVYVYAGYSDDRTSHFNTHTMAFKLFFWAMIRTGNPQFAGKDTNQFLSLYLGFCISILGFSYYRYPCTKYVTYVQHNLFENGS